MQKSDQILCAEYEALLSVWKQRHYNSVIVIVVALFPTQRAKWNKLDQRD